MTQPYPVYVVLMHQIKTRKLTKEELKQQEVPNDVNNGEKNKKYGSYSMKHTYSNIKNGKLWKM